MKRRTKEEEIERDDYGPPTRQDFFSKILSDLNKAVPNQLENKLNKWKLGKGLLANRVLRGGWFRMGFAAVHVPSQARDFIEFQSSDAAIWKTPVCNCKEKTKAK